ncbi:MAG TPA: tetratricopeptide repeat protein [Candidatus Acidoferrum sp.]|nr:tetratricopeptide repeat protein [Candidatus Acidoferrum sp.]
MKGTGKQWLSLGTLAGFFFCACIGASAQTAQSGQSGQSSQSGQSTQSGQSGQTSQSGQAATAGQAQGDKDKADSLSLSVAPPPVDPAEDAAFKAFNEIPITDGAKKTAAGEEFAQKYPQSRYLPPVYSSLVKLYLEANDLKKMQDVGEKDVALAPNDVQTLAILGQTLPRAWNSTMPNAADQLDKAEKYSKSAIELTPTIAKPVELSDAQFAMAKNQTLAMAHSGLGLVYFRRGKFDAAIPEFEEATRVDPGPGFDPVNYYVLGISEEKTSHFAAAESAFEKCATAPGGLQATCKNGAAEAKKLSQTQLSAPQ